MFGEQGFDVNALLAQAQAMQSQMQRAQEELAARRVRGSAGGDLVEVTVNGAGELLAVDIKPEAWDPEDPETLSALIIAAFRAAKAEADSATAAAMPDLPSMPPMPGLGG